jgi:uncharacterized protein YqeY
MIRQKLSDALKVALKAREMRATSTLRLILAALKDRDIDARGRGVDGGIGEDDILLMLQTMIRQRRESIEQYQKGGRPDLVAQEQEEIAIIETFLPRQFSTAEIEALVESVIKESGAATLKDMGRVMAALKSQHAGQMDFTKTSALVKARLGGG